MQRFVMQYGPTIIDWTTRFAEGLGSLIQMFMDSESWTETFVNVFKAGFTHIMEFAQKALTFMYFDVIKPGLKWMADKWAGLWDYMKQTSIYQWMAEKWAWLSDKLLGAWVWLYNSLMKIPLVGRALKALGATGEISKGDITGGFEILGETIKETWRWAADHIDEAMMKVSNFEWTRRERKEREDTAKARGPQGVAIGALARGRAMTAAQWGMETAAPGAVTPGQLAARARPGLGGRTELERRLGADIQFGKKIAREVDLAAGEDARLTRGLLSKLPKETAAAMAEILKMSKEEEHLVWFSNPVGEPEL